MALTDGMAPEGLSEEVEDALDGVMERVETLSQILQAEGYEAGTAMFHIARDELVEVLAAETGRRPDTDTVTDTGREEPCCYARAAPRVPTPGPTAASSAANTSARNSWWTDTTSRWQTRES